MTKTIDATEISDIPGLREIIAKMRESRRPHELRDHGELVAILLPASETGPKSISQEDYDAFRRAAGGWADVDTDQLLHDIYEDRKLNTRPPIDL